MLHAENLKVLYLKSPTSWRMNWRPCLVNSKEISVDFLKSILMKAKLPIENCYPWRNFINMFFVVSSSSICLLLILLKNENERLEHSVQLLSHVWLFVIPWTAACQASCPSPAPGVYSNSRPLSWWCHPTISSSASPSPPAFNLPSIRIFSNESALRIRWPKYWSFSFSFSPSNEYSGLISFRMDWMDLPAVQATLKSSPTPQFKSINSSALSFLYSSKLISIHDYWKNNSFD